MTRSTAATPEEYLAELPPDRREAVSALRDLINRRIAGGYRESVAWGMLAWGIPLERFPDTYNGQPLCCAALAAQKNYNSLYLMSVYQDSAEADRLARAARERGTRLDMGKSCIRFRRLDELPLDAIGDILSAATPEALIARHEEVHGPRRSRKRS